MRSTSSSPATRSSTASRTPRPTSRGAALLGVDLADCIAIEDSPPGLASALAAGAVALGVEHHAPLADDGGYTRADDPEGHHPRRPPPISTRPRRTATRPPRRRLIRLESSTSHDRDPPTVRPVPRGRQGPAHRPQGQDEHHRADPGRRLPHAPRHDQPRRRRRPARRLGVASTTGDEYLALRPLLGDFVMSMPRGAAIVYPKDAAQIVAFADIFPGATVVEAGVGSGALSLWLLRAIGPEGRLASFERRQEFADVAEGNVASFFGAEPANWSVTVGDLVDELPGGDARRHRRPRRARHARPVGERRRRRPTALKPGGAGRLLRRHGHPALAGRRGVPRLGSASPNPTRPRRWSAAGTSRGSPCAPTTA